jgi:hypothetical protein
MPGSVWPLSTVSPSLGLGRVSRAPVTATSTLLVGCQSSSRLDAAGTRRSHPINPHVKPGTLYTEMCWVPNKYSWSSSIQLNCVWPGLMDPSEIWCFQATNSWLPKFDLPRSNHVPDCTVLWHRRTTIQTIWCSVRFSYSPSSSSTVFHCCNTQPCKTVVIRVADCLPKRQLAAHSYTNCMWPSFTKSVTVSTFQA